MNKSLLSKAAAQFGDESRAYLDHKSLQDADIELIVEGVLQKALALNQVMTGEDHLIIRTTP